MTRLAAVRICLGYCGLVGKMGLMFVRVVREMRRGLEVG